MTPTTPEQADEAALAVIRRAVYELVHHPRFASKPFGPVSAEELLYKVSKFLEAHPGKHWPVRGVEVTDATHV